MNNDLISREALREKAETITLWNGDVRRFVSYETIDNAPTVMPEKAKEGEIVKAYTKGFDNGVEIARNERPQGEWFYNDYGNGCGNWHCSICGHLPFYAQKYMQHLNYCPNCGAKMKGGAEE